MLGAASLALVLAATPAAAHDYCYRAEVVRVIDGDTIVANVDLGFRTWRHHEHLRLISIDAPEMRGDERMQGINSRNALAQRVLGRMVRICTEKDRTGKYGRYLATIWLGEENINEWMLQEGLAEPYSEGGTRAGLASETEPAA